MSGCVILDSGIAARKNGKKLPCEVLQAENAKLREACAELLHMAETAFPEWLHWPEMHDELRELGIEVDDA